MGLYFYNYCNLHKLKKDLKIFIDKYGAKNKFFIIGFSDFSTFFLTQEYNKIVNFLKEESKKNICFLLCFYIKFLKKDVNAIFIEKGRIKNVFGESFSNKNLVLKLQNKRVLILFYFELYDSKIKQKIDLTKIDLTIGIDNDYIDDNIVFLDNKFFNKLVFVGLNGKINCIKKENILKIEENLVKYNIQKLT